MKIRFSLFVILCSNFFLNGCTENKPTAYVPVPGYPAPRSIKQVEAEDSWKKRADEMMLARKFETPVKHSAKILKTTSVIQKKAVRKLSSSRKAKAKLLALNTRAKGYKKVLPVW